jgi:alkanesulfonate monooxygenase SsuD/methylene tetrahydromethanopterin reductase-like flavin-dependent oxidoreductase (luciferase family)
MYRESLEEGFAREGARRTADDFEVVATVPFLVADDVQQAADAVRPFYALYFGGMGAKGKNFHANVAIRMGYESMVDEVQELYLSGKKEEAGAAIPFELIDELSLIGPPDRIRDRVAAWRESIVTTLLISGDANLVRQAAEIVLD